MKELLESLEKADREIYAIQYETKEEIKKIKRKAELEINKIEKNVLPRIADDFARIGWDSWTEVQLHSTGQFTRLEKALDEEMELLSSDNDRGTYEVKSASGNVHIVSSTGCDCKDCRIRRLPCKHMYFVFLLLTYPEFRAACEQLTLDGDEKDPDSPNVQQSVLGCCQKYRECSLAGKCLQEDEHYKSCSYRKNLESGNVFYSKSANAFSRERYDYINDFRASLGAEAGASAGTSGASAERNAFDKILLYFTVSKRGCKRCLCLNTPVANKIITNCKAFKLLPKLTLTMRLFDANLIKSQRAAKLHKKYSKLPAPELFPIIPKDPTASKEEEDARLAQNQKINAQNVEIWKKHYKTDPELQDVLSKYFIYFEIDDYSSELEEYSRSNYDDLSRTSDEFVFFDPEMPKIFRDRIDDMLALETTEDEDE